MLLIKSSHLKQFGSSSVSNFVSQVAAVVSSVPGLVLVVPSVEVVVEEHDTSRRHASYDAPSRKLGGNTVRFFLCLLFF